MSAIQIGDAHDVACELHLQRDSLEWLAAQCPEGDGFTDELWKALDRIDREAAEQKADEDEFGRPALALQIGEDGVLYFHAYRADSEGRPISDSGEEG